MQQIALTGCIALYVLYKFTTYVLLVLWLAHNTLSTGVNDSDYCLVLLH